MANRDAQPWQVREDTVGVVPLTTFAMIKPQLRHDRC